MKSFAAEDYSSVTTSFAAEDSFFGCTLVVKNRNNLVLVVENFTKLA
jgi:hypothetical protein